MIRFVLALCAAFSLATPAFASFEVSPIVIDVVGSEGRYEGEFVVVNPRSQPLAVEITVEERVFDAQSGETLVPADGDFLIFPLQTAIDPGKRQVVRLSYLGVIEDSSRSFRLRVTEVLAPLSEEQARGSGIRTRYQFAPSLHISPRGAEPDLVIESVQREASAQSENKAAITIRNRGNRYAYLNEREIVFGEFIVDQATIVEAMAPRPVGPGAAMTLVVDVPQTVDFSQTPGEIRMAQTR